jgi:hypothetical protein
MIKTLRQFVLLCFLIAGCAGSHDEALVVDLLPVRLAGVRLIKESFTGAVWLSARPEFFSPYFVPEARADVRRFLARLGRSEADLTVAWATAPEGIQVIGYQVRGTKPSQLIDAYIEAASATTRARRTEIAGREVILVAGSARQRAFLYAHRDVLYSANSYHVDGSELEELISKLPGDRPASAPIAQLLPTTLGGVRLERETFAGKVWLEAAPEETFQPEVKVELSRFLENLDQPTGALSVAWATAPDGPKVVAYRVTAVEGDALLRAFVRAVPDVRIRMQLIAGKQVTVADSGVTGKLGYLYVHDDTLFVAGTNHLRPDETHELIAKLP